jgi:hypothetical protein
VSFECSPVVVPVYLMRWYQMRVLVVPVQDKRQVICGCLWSCLGLLPYDNFCCCFQEQRFQGLEVVSSCYEVAGKFGDEFLYLVGRVGVLLMKAGQVPEDETV